MATVISILIRSLLQDEKQNVSVFNAHLTAILHADKNNNLLSCKRVT